MAGSSTRRSGTTLTVVLLLLLAGASAFALLKLAEPGVAENVAALRSAAESGRADAALASAAETGLLPWLLIPTLGPIAIALVALLTSRRAEPVAGSEATDVTAGEQVESKGETRAPADARRDDSASSGLKLLATLQEEARLLDFVREDIAGYSDEQVGAAVRGIHAALRKAIDDRLEIEPILAGDEGDPVEVPAAMPAGHLRLSGRAVGAPPFRGVLRHGGWRATVVRLPAATPGSDPAVLAPAEVEVGEE
jgi:hypothetical protein